LRADAANISSSSGSIAAGYTFIATGCLLLFVSFLGLLPRWVPKPLVYLGKISYGLYVFHMLSLSVFWRLFWFSENQRSSLQTGSGIILGARAVLILLLSLGMTVMCATLSYRFLERPFLAMKERFTFVRSRTA
jgi:peptidoglycan/LPS O-acetylase OafA/YrhL